MKFAICNETFQDMPMEAAFEMARSCGYTGIEIAPFTMNKDARQITANERRQVVRQAEQSGLEVIGLHWLLAHTEGYHLTSPEPEVRQRTADYLIELAQLCRDLGGSIMVFGSPKQRNVLDGVTHHQANDYACDVFDQVTRTLEDLDVTIALEPLGPAEGNYLNTADEAVALMRSLGSPRYRLHLDCKAMSTEPQPIPEIIRANSEHLEHFHANDPNMLGPGFGELDFEPILAALDEARYNGWVSVEVFDYSPGAEEIARRSIETLRRCQPTGW